jgi:CubicO group peptidase (beta-lactamase class C family)
MKYRIFCTVLAIGVLLGPGGKGSAQEEFPYQIFERYLEPLMQQIGMPGLSAAILQNGTIAWRKSYGYADVDNKIPAAFDTPYPIGGITQAVTGVLTGVCIDRFNLEIDNDIRFFDPGFPVAGTSVRQVLAHATGGRFKYDTALYTSLTKVVEAKLDVPRKCLNQTFRQATATEIFDPLAMNRSVPGLDLGLPEGAAAREQFDERTWSRYQSVLSQVAVPYRIDLKGRYSRSEYPSYGLDAATGLVSTVEDLAKFEGKLDKRDNNPLSASTLDRMWSNASFRVTVNGQEQNLVVPTGLGWFVTTESGQRLVWTFGHIPNASSALIVKMTKRQANGQLVDLTLIMLANSGGLAQGYDLENANVTSSPFVKVFLRLFI